MNDSKKPGGPDNGDMDNDESIIELTELAEDPDTPDDPADDDIIELTEVVEEPASPASEIFEDTDESPDELELEPLALSDSEEADGTLADDGLQTSMGLTLEEIPTSLTLESAILEEGEPRDSGASSLRISDDRLNTALEKIVREIYGEKIEKMILEVVQKTISKEIERLKSMIQGRDIDGEI